MTISPRIVNFPTFGIAKQLFHVPGAAAEGGFTTGGSRILSPEPGGYSRLELQPSMRDEWEYPLASWLMSQTNGQLMRVRLTKTPQLAGARLPPVNWDNSQPWSNNQPWSGGYSATYYDIALEGSNVVKVNLSAYGQVLRPGHVIGHGDTTYKIDEIAYDQNNLATITVMPPLRKNVVGGDTVYFQPYFIGYIANAESFRTMYEAALNGNIQLGAIIMNEAVV